MVGSPTQRAGSGRKALPEGWEVERDRRYQEALRESQEESRGLGEVGRLPGGPGGVRRDGRGWKAQQEGWEESGGPHRDSGLGGHPG